MRLNFKGISFTKTKKIFIEIGEMFAFMWNVLRQFFTHKLETVELVRQSYLIGNKTLSLIGITGFIMGFVLTMQTRPVMMDFGASALVPGMIAISLIREIGPVITALLCAGKLSSGIGAEIAAMKVTEQIDAMEVSGTNPMNYVVATRVLATTLMVPILVFFADFLGLLGSFFAINIKEPMSIQLYFAQAFSALEFSDLLPSVIKSIFFGFFVGLIGAYKGYSAKLGTESVGNAANSAVVTASLTIFIIDLLVAQITELFIGF